MIVIADTSPLNYLVLIGEADILQRLYRRVVIPEAVLRELLHPENTHHHVGVDSAPPGVARG